MKVRLGSLGPRFGALVPCLALALAQAASARPCELAGGDREWIDAAIEVWGRAAKALGRPLDAMPWTVLYDESCVVHLAARSSGGRSSSEPARRDLAVSFGGAPVAVRTERYRRRFTIPSGAKLGSEALAFTSLAKDGDTFFVMALPSVWKKDPRSMPGEDIEEFASGVLAHEMTHTIHLRSIQAAIAGLQERYSMPESIDDDTLQSIFAGDPAYVAAYERELALYLRAVGEADDEAARALVRQALDASRERRARFFQGERAFFVEVEPFFLNMEGVASWVAYSVVGHHSDPIEFAGRFWSQQEGLVLFLLLDRFASDWKGRVFDPAVPSPFAMLRQAIGAAG